MRGESTSAITAAEGIESAARAGAAILAGQDPWADLVPTARSIVLAAVDSFATRGFHATTLKHIAAGTGLSTAALYVHFSSKDDLLYEISRRGHEAALAVVEAAAALDPPGHAFRALVYAFTRWHAEQRTTARVVQYELNALGPEHAAAIVALRRGTESVVRAVIAGVADEHVEARGTSAAVLSLGIDVARWFEPGRPYTPDGIARLYCALATRMARPSDG